MDKNVYSNAAVAVLSKLRKCSKRHDTQITRNRGAGPLGEIYGKITVDSEDGVDHSTEHMFTLEELGLRINTDGEDYMTKHLCRSCRPNCRLQHLFGSKTFLAVFVVTSQRVSPGDQFTIGFNHDWQLSKIPLICAYHNDGECPMEIRRLQCAQWRQVFRSMNRLSLKQLDESVKQLIVEMEEKGKRRGTITVSGDEVHFGVGTKKTRKYVSSSTESEESEESRESTPSTSLIQTLSGSSKIVAELQQKNGT